MSLQNGQCIHFNGIRNLKCEKGVLYEQFSPGVPCIQLIHFSASGGTYLAAGEKPASTRPFSGAQPKERCPFYQEPADEQVHASRTESDAASARTVVVAIKLAAQWRVCPKPSHDRAEVVECPVCKGRLHLSQSAYNGHVRGKCETDDCVEWVE